MSCNAPSTPYTIHQYTYRSSVAANEASLLHSHDFYQLIYAASGSGYIHSDSTRIKISQREAFLISPNFTHSICGSDINLHTYEFKFALNDNYKKYASQIENRVLHCNKDVQDFIIETTHETKSNTIYAKEIIALHIPQIILKLAALSTQSGDENSIDASATDETFLAYCIKNYIIEHYAKNILSKEIAKSFFLSDSHMRRIFTKTYNMSPIKYRNNYRIDMAKNLMKSTDLSITEISELVGFDNLYYFSRYFTAREKITPSKYKASVKGNFTHTFNEY